MGSMLMECTTFSTSVKQAACWSSERTVWGPSDSVDSVSLPCSVGSRVLRRLYMLLIPLPHVAACATTRIPRFRNEEVGADMVALTIAPSDWLTFICCLLCDLIQCQPRHLTVKGRNASTCRHRVISLNHKLRQPPSHSGSWVNWQRRKLLCCVVIDPDYLQEIGVLLQ